MSSFVDDHASPTVFADGSGRRYVKLLCVVHKCGTCGGNMMSSSAKRVGDCGNDTELFPCWIDATIDAQMKRAGLRWQSGSKSKKNEYICVECESSGKSTFVCSLCKQERDSSQKQESFGDPPDFLCKVCYETKPAKEWEAKSEALIDAHRWDYD